MPYGLADRWVRLMMVSVMLYLMVPSACASQATSCLITSAQSQGGTSMQIFSVQHTSPSLSSNVTRKQTVWPATFPGSVTTTGVVEFVPNGMGSMMIPAGCGCTVI